MKKVNIQFGLILIVIAIILYGCAPRHVKSDELRNINRVGIATHFKDNELKVLDLARFRQSVNSRYPYGGILDLLVKEAVIATRSNWLVKGDLALLRESLADYPVNSIFDDIFYKEYMRSLEGKKIPSITMIDVDEFAGVSEEQYIGHIKSDYPEIDTIIRIDILYGIGVPDDEMPQPGIAADVVVISIRDKRILMRNTITTRAVYLRGHTVSEYTEHNGALFKVDFEDVVGAFARNLSNGYIF